MIIFSDFELQLLYIICIDMVKKVQKKLKKKKTKKKDTLPPGKKKCRNCD